MSNEASPGPAPKATTGDVLELFGKRDELEKPVLTNGDVAGELGVSSETARRRLNDLRDEGEVIKLDLGVMVAWYRPEDIPKLVPDGGDAKWYELITAALMGMGGFVVFPLAVFVVLSRFLFTVSDTVFLFSGTLMILAFGMMLAASLYHLTRKRHGDMRLVGIIDLYMGRILSGDIVMSGQDRIEKQQLDD